LTTAKEKLIDKMNLPLLVESDESYSIGVIGLVAGRLVDEFHKPTIIISLGPDICQASCRSIPEFNLTTILKDCQELLITFGGHPLAAGFTVTRQNLPQLEKKLMELAMTQLSQYDLRPILSIDAEIPLSTLTSDNINLIQQLEPFGQGNPYPTFLTKKVEVSECHNFGNSNNYLNLKLQQGNASWQAVDFHSKTKQAKIPTYIDIVYNLEKRIWNGEETLRLNLIDFMPSV
jgi:single-stranded-DNA-specific exonuclease